MSLFKIILCFLNNFSIFFSNKKITYSPGLPSVAPAAPVDIVDVDVVVEKVVEEVVVWARFPFFLPASVRPMRPSKALKVQYVLTVVTIALIFMNA